MALRGTMVYWQDDTSSPAPGKPMSMVCSAEGRKRKSEPKSRGEAELLEVSCCPVRQVSGTQSTLGDKWWKEAPDKSKSSAASSSPRVPSGTRQGQGMDQ